jgi:ribosomal protein L35AE/L33A
MPRSYYGKRMPRGAKTGWNSRKKSSNIAQHVLNSSDKLRDQQKNKDCFITFKNVGASGTEDTLDATHSGLQTGLVVNYDNSHNTDLKTLIIEPINWDQTSKPSGPQHMAGQRYFYKSIEADLSLSTVGTRGAGGAHNAPCNVEVMLVKIKGSNANAFGTTGAAQLFSLNKDNELAKTNVFKLLYKRYVLTAGDSGVVKIKFMKNLNTVVKREVETETFGSEDRATERYALVIRFLKHSNATENVLCIDGYVKSRAFEL